MDDNIKKAIKAFLISKLGIFGVFTFRREVSTCNCIPCKTLIQLFTELDNEKNSSKARDTQSK